MPISFEHPPALELSPDDDRPENYWSKEFEIRIGDRLFYGPVAIITKWSIGEISLTSCPLDTECRLVSHEQVTEAHWPAYLAALLKKEN